MNLAELEKKKVAVLGFGQEGQAVVSYLLKHGIKPAILDKKELSEFSQTDQENLKALGLELILGPDYLQRVPDFEVAFRSPGLWRLHPQLLEAEKKGLVITSQAKWFFENANALTVGVTGTKGKGTTSSLIAKILEEQYKNNKVYLTGNVGNVQPLEFLDNLNTTDYVVYELSSFQLQDLGVSPHVAVVLMVTSEHLDSHKTISEYHEAKQQITEFQGSDDFAIINADFEASVKIGEQSKGNKLFFSRTKELDVGCFKQDGYLVIRGLKSAGIFAPDNNEFIDTTKLKLRGQHNLENAAAASLAALALGASQEVIQKVCYEFLGLEHRLELVGTHQGVSFYNDSFSTIPETAIAAIKSFTEPLIVILGGSEKFSDFTELGKVVAETKNIKAVILVGETAFRIKEAIASGGYKNKILEGAQNMKEIFDQIKTVSKAGDVALLSPACASFGMFKNYKDRGEQFKQQVTDWGGNNG